MADGDCYIKNHMKSGIETRKKIYQFLVGYITDNLYPPSIREICEGVGLKSSSSVFRHLQTLEQMGKIEIRDWSPRAIKLIGYKIIKGGDEK